MFDLIGFWLNVSVITFLMSGIWYLLFYQLSAHFVSKITRDKKITKRWEDFLYKDVNGNNGIFFGRIPIPIVLLLASLVCSVFGAIISLGMWFAHSTSIITWVSEVSAYLAPYTAWVGLFYAIYFGVIVVGQKAWDYISKLTSVLNKLEGKHND